LCASMQWTKCEKKEMVELRKERKGEKKEIKKDKNEREGK